MRRSKAIFDLILEPLNPKRCLAVTRDNAPGGSLPWHCQESKEHSFSSSVNVVMSFMSFAACGNSPSSTPPPHTHTYLSLPQTSGFLSYQCYLLSVCSEEQRALSNNRKQDYALSSLSLRNDARQIKLLGQLAYPLSLPACPLSLPVCPTVCVCICVRECAHLVCLCVYAYVRLCVCMRARPRDNDINDISHENSCSANPAKPHWALYNTTL